MAFDSAFWTSHTLLGNSPQQTLDINVIWSVHLFSFKLINYFFHFQNVKGFVSIFFLFLKNTIVNKNLHIQRHPQMLSYMSVVLPTGLYILLFFTTSSVKLFVQIFVYRFLFTIVFFGKRKKQSQNLSHFRNESPLQKRTTFWKWKHVFGKVKSD